MEIIKIFKNYFSKKEINKEKIYDIQKDLNHNIKKYYEENNNDIIYKQCYLLFPIYYTIKEHIKDNKLKYTEDSLSSLYVFLKVYELLKNKKILTKEEIELNEIIFKKILYIDIDSYKKTDILRSLSFRLYENSYNLNEKFLEENLKLIEEKNRIKNIIDNF